MAQNRNHDKYKLFNDPIHGSMTFHPVLVAIIDTPQFQRLRDLKQLGGGYYVYPGASHNRFEHSLGVCHLAGQLLEELRASDGELGITDDDILMVQIAGLCHDMGHGPFSHTFDNRFMPLLDDEVSKSLPGDSNEQSRKRLKHEDLSLLMFEHMIETNKVLKRVLDENKIDEKKREIIKAFIHSSIKEQERLIDKYREILDKKEFLFEVVANKRNGVDVDKWDYFKRDGYCLGIQTAFDHGRMMKFCRVIEVDGKRQICLRDKEAFNLYEMFVTRQTLYRKAYEHKTVKAVEAMIVHGLLEAKHVRLIEIMDGTEVKKLSLSEWAKAMQKKKPEPMYMEAFTKLTDSIFYQIMFSEDDALKKAKTWMEAIHKRQIYRLVAEAGPFRYEKSVNDTDKITSEIQDAIKKRFQQANTESLKANHFFVQIATMDFGNRESNPMENVRFYSKGEETKPITVLASQISTFLPDENKHEKYVRVFLLPSGNEEDDKKYSGLVSEGFQDWHKTAYPQHYPKTFKWTYDRYQSVGQAQ